MLSNLYIALIFQLLFLGIGVYFWMKGTGRIKNTNPDYVPSLGIFKICGAIMVVIALLMLVISLVKFCQV
jgi:hypothetical protein